ncbi:Protein argonaute-2 [Eumeta japonica]|uniref:Protein argonaute-2 n=1 Tax=Eumeta variegata TaxID=151549 RepID=A0A4C1V532_EUMVA|nr:Protein argonaute-2 [Eumeta japonica]
MIYLYRHFIPKATSIQASLNALFTGLVKNSYSVNIIGEALEAFNTCKDRKKKGKKDAEENKPEELSKAVSDLSIRPSTSTATTSSTTAQDTESESKTEETTTPVGDVLPLKPTPDESKQTTATVDDDDEGGLGLGGAKKKRPRKKKQATSEGSSQKEPIQGPPSEPQPVTHPAQSWTQQAHTALPPQGQVRPPGERHVDPSHQGQVVPQPWGHLPTAPPSYREPSPRSFSPPQRPAWPATGAPPARPHAHPPSFARPLVGYGRGLVQPPPDATAPPPGCAPEPVLVQQSQRSRPTETEIVSKHHVIAKPKDAQKPSRFSIPDKIIGRSVGSRPVKVLTNYLPMKIKGMKIYRYDVGFKPDRPKKLLPKAFHASFDKNFPKLIVAFDQMKNFYSMKALPNVTSTERFTDNVEIVDNNGKKMSFEVSYKSTGVVDLNTIMEYMKGGTSLNPPTEAIQCVDVILRQGTLQSYVKCGRTFFIRPANPIPLEDGLEMWTGLFQSAIFTSSPFINIDVAHKGFPINQPVINLLQTFRLDINSPLETQKYSFEMLNSYLKGLKVVAKVGGDTALKREFICNGLGQPANRQKFTLTNSAGKQIEMTVANYFMKEKNCRLQYPNLNVLSVGPKDKNIYYPMELLEVSYGQLWATKVLITILIGKHGKSVTTGPHQILHVEIITSEHCVYGGGVFVRDANTYTIAMKRRERARRTAVHAGRALARFDDIRELGQIQSEGGGRALLRSRRTGGREGGPRQNYAGVVEEGARADYASASPDAHQASTNPVD